MRWVSLLLLCCLLISSFVSCGEPPEAFGLLSSFISSYGTSGVLYSPNISEGERGYIDENFFVTLYGCEADFESDYAVFLSSSIDSVFEAAVFVTNDESSEIFACELAHERLLLLSEMGFGDNSLLLVRGGVVFYSTLPDAPRAERIWLDMDM